MRRLVPAIWLAVAALSFWLRASFPIAALGSAGADDALFVRLAQSLAQGHWLGPYDNLTLAKGMFYPLFIAGSAWLGLPLNLTEQAVYLLMAAAAAYAARRTSRLPGLGTVVFTALALDPVLWENQLTRVVREALYISLGPAVLVLFTALCFASRRRIPLALATAAAAAAFWLTREEGVWLLPALLTVLLLASAGLGIRRLPAMGGAVLLAGLAFAAGNATVAEINRRAYGSFVTTEFQSGAFKRGYGALAGIKQDDWRPYVVFPSDARQRAYAASPAARELAPYLDGAIGESWRKIGCETMNLTPARCPEILAAWFMWALRDAVTAAGHGRSAKDALGFHARLADEIGAACDQGRLDCTAPHRATLAPIFRAEYLAPAWQAALALARLVLTPGGTGLPWERSSGLPPERAAFRDMAGPIATEAEQGQDFVGWIAAPSVPGFAVLPAPGQAPAIIPTTRGGADVERSFPTLKAIRFDLATTCQPGTCDLLLLVPGADPVTLPWSALHPGNVLDTPGLKVWIDSATPFPAAPVTAARLRAQHRLAAVIASCYCVGTPVAAGLALAGLLLAAWRRRTSRVLFALAAASLVAVLSRIALLAYLDATAIPSVNPLYASPAAVFVILFAVLGIAAGLEALVPESAASAKALDGPPAL